MQTDYFDEETKGLALRVSRSGLKSWTYHYTAIGKRSRLTFGNYPATSLGSARTRADEARSRGPQAISKAETLASNLRRISEPLQSADEGMAKGGA